MKISLVTATFNCADTLKDTMESVVNQTHQDIEYIVVDGNVHDDKDPTPRLIETFRPRFGNRLIYIREADKGLYDAMNKGFARATGDVVGLLNADDFFTAPDVLETVARTLTAHPEVQALYGDVHYVRPDNLNRCVRYYSSRPFRRSWMRLGFMPAHPSFYCRTEVYRRLGTFNTSYRVAADFELLLRLLYVHRTPTLYVEKDFVTMRTGGASSSGMASHKQIMRDHRKALRANGVKSSYFLLSLRYIYKVCEVLRSRIRRNG